MLVSKLTEAAYMLCAYAVTQKVVELYSYAMQEKNGKMNQFKI